MGGTQRPRNARRGHTQSSTGIERTTPCSSENLHAWSESDCSLFANVRNVKKSTPLQRTATSMWEVLERTVAPSLRENACFPLRHARLFPDPHRVRESHRLLSHSAGHAKTCTRVLPATR